MLKIIRSWQGRVIQGLTSINWQNRTVLLTENETAKPTTDHPLKQTYREIRGILIAIGSFSAVINILMLVGPLYMLQVYDRVLTSGSHETLVYLTVLALVLVILNAFLELVRSRLLIRSGSKLNDSLDHSVFSGLFKPSNNPVAAKSLGTLPLQDLKRLRSFAAGPGPLAFFDAPWTPLFILLIFSFHPLLGFVALIGGLILFSLAVLSELSTRNISGEAAVTANNASMFADASYRNIEVVRGMGMIPQLHRRWQNIHRTGISQSNIAADRIGLLNSISKLVRPALQICMLGTGAYLVLQAETSAGVMIASSIIMGRALAPVEAAVGQWRSFLAARTAFFRLFDFLNFNDVDIERVALPKPEGNLSVSSLTLIPAGQEKAILKDVSFNVKAGEIVGVIGPSGSGKSSLARCLVGVWGATVGTVRLDGADIRQWAPEDLGLHMGYLPQDVELFDGTIAENIARFYEIDSDEMIAAANLAGAHEMILHLPDGYETNVGPNGAALSGGQRQRIGLARAVYGSPSFIVLDEPNASLDGEGEKALMDALESLRKLDKTVVIISHRSNILTVVDKVLILRNGSVELFGDHDQVMPRLLGKVSPMQPKRVEKPKKVSKANATKA